MATPYALPTDVLSFIGAANVPPTPPYDTAELTRLIARAQDLIDNQWLIHCVFATDTSGNPTDATVIATLLNATCAQVESWISTGDELNELGQWQQFTVEGITMSRSSDAEAYRRERICERAKDYLRGNRLMANWVSVP